MFLMWIEATSRCAQNTTVRLSVAWAATRDHPAPAQAANPVPRQRLRRSSCVGTAVSFPENPLKVNDAASDDAAKGQHVVCRRDI